VTRRYRRWNDSGQVRSYGYQLVESKVANDCFNCATRRLKRRSPARQPQRFKKAFSVSFWKSRNRQNTHCKSDAPLPLNNKTDVDK
jgi:hypothetical protein